MRGAGIALSLGACLMVGCNDAAAPPDDADLAGQADLGGLAADLSSGCPRLPAAEDRVRKVVVSHPYTAMVGVKGKSYEVLELTAQGALSRTGVTFEMGRSAVVGGPIAFTPDGEVGMVVQEDGSLGVFRFEAGAPVVVHAGFQDHFYADAIVIDPTGTRVYVLDSNTDNNGGGVYAADIGCDGTLTGRGRLIGGGLGNALALLPRAPQKGIYATGALPGDVHQIDLAGGTVDANGDAFGDRNAIPSALAVSLDGKLALVADNGFGAGNRIAAVSLPALTQVTLLTTPNPAGLVASPFGDAFLLLNSDGMDALRIISYDPSLATPVAIKGELAYTNGKPQLPAAAALIERGALRGRVLVAENLAVRQVQLAAGAQATDVSLLSFGTGSASIVGTVGVQP